MPGPAAEPDEDLRLLERAAQNASDLARQLEVEAREMVPDQEAIHALRQAALTAQQLAAAITATLPSSHSREPLR